MKKIACSILLLLVAFVAMAQDTKQMPSHEQLTELFKMYDQMQSELDSTGQNLKCCEIKDSWKRTTEQLKKYNYEVYQK